MIRPALLVAILLIGASVFGQQDSVRKYLDAELHFTTKANSVYPAMAIKNGDHWVLIVVRPSDTVTLMRVSFKDAALTIKDGSYTIYHARNLVSQTGSFKDNMPDGRWQAWFKNKQLKNEGVIINNNFSGVWKYWHENGKLRSEATYRSGDSIINKPVIETYEGDYKHGILNNFSPSGVRQGPSTSWYENGNKECELNYLNDSLSGLCVYYRENGNLSTKETYANGKVTDLECYNDEGVFTGASCSILKPPVFTHPFFSALEYIEYELHKDKKKDIDEEGDAMVTFTVTKKGTISNLVFISSPDKSLNEHIRKIFEKMPAWSPAIVHNQAIDYNLRLIIPYYR